MKFLTFRQGINVLTAFLLDNVQITATAAEINKLAGLTTTAAELLLLRTASVGTAVASKAAVLGASKNLDILGLPVGGLKIGVAGAEVVVTPTAAEMNKLAGVAGGVASASLAAVLGASKNLDILGLPVGGLKIGAAGAEVVVTPTAAEINVLAAAGVSNADLVKVHSGLAYDPGRPAVAVIDFNTGAAEAGCAVTIGGVAFQEADVAVPATGVWTNGASAADSAASFLAAVNGLVGSLWTAVLSSATESVIIAAKTAGAAGNVAITTTSVGRITVDNPAHGGTDATLRQVVMVRYVATAQDLLADEVDIPLPFAPVAWTVQCRSTAGLIKVATWLVTAGTAPNRIKLLKAGATDLIAGDVVELVAWA